MADEIMTFNDPARRLIYDSGVIYWQSAYAIGLPRFTRPG